MRRKSKYIYDLREWPTFKWDGDEIILPLASVCYKQGRLLGRMQDLPFHVREEATVETLTREIIQSCKMDGEELPAQNVRSTVARRLEMGTVDGGIEDRKVHGIVDMMLEATQKYSEPLTEERLLEWHVALFPARTKGGLWRSGSMQVMSGTSQKQDVRYKALPAARLGDEIRKFLRWFNETPNKDGVLKAAIAHLWFVTISPFGEGNERVARVITELQLARADGSAQRFYTMSSQMYQEQNAYCEILEKTRKGTLDITKWLRWFLECLDRAISLSEEHLSGVIQKAKSGETRLMVSLNERQRRILDILTDEFNQMTPAISTAPHGKLTSSMWAKIAQCSPDTALRDIQDLIEKGILEKAPGGGRSTSYRMNIK